MPSWPVWSPIVIPGKMIMKASHCILVVIAWFLMSVVSSAQTADSLRLHQIEKRYNIFFPINSSEIDSTFQNNSHTIDIIRQDIENTFRKGTASLSPTDSIIILSTTSPDGTFQYNQQLARNRAVSTSLLIQELFPEFPVSNIKVQYVEEDWDGLRQILRTNPDFPQRKDMLDIIESQLAADDKEEALRNCKEGWEHLLDNHIYALRNSSITLTVLGVRDEFATPRPLERVSVVSYIPIIEAPETHITYTRETECIRRSTVMALRSNLLVPAGNVGMEFCLGDNWSIGADYYFPWLKRKADHQNALQLLGWGIEGRYWFGKARTEGDRLKGHSIGLSAYAGYYDFERSYKGMQGEFATIGLDYLYAMPIYKGKLHLEFNLGFGYIYSYVKPYDVFETGGKAFKEGYIKNFHWVGPVKAGVSLVVPISITKNKL